MRSEGKRLPSISNPTTNHIRLAAGASMADSGIHGQENLKWWGHDISLAAGPPVRHLLPGVSVEIAILIPFY